MTSEDREEINRMVDAAMARFLRQMMPRPGKVEEKIAEALAKAAPHFVAAAELVGERGPEIYIPKLSDVVLPEADD